MHIKATINTSFPSTLEVFHKFTIRFVALFIAINKGINEATQSVYEF